MKNLKKKNHFMVDLAPVKRYWRIWAWWPTLLTYYTNSKNRRPALTPAH